MIFKYKRIDRPAPFPTIHAPAIPVTIAGKKDSVDVVGLIDSGADFSVIPREMAEIIGADLSNKPEEIGGIGGNTKAIETKIKMTITKGHEAYTQTISAYVVEDLQDSFPILIGRSGFFPKFKITFAEKTKKILLKRDVSRPR